MAKVSGSLWVAGSTLHYVDKVGAEWYFTGTAGSTPAGAIIGSIWVDAGTSTLHYIDGAGVDRATPVSNVTDRSGVGALPGSLWVESSANNNYSLHSIDNGHIERAAHDDTHNDVAHTDVAHNDVAHNDVAPVHTDVAHSDGGHADVAHGDVSGSAHADTPHHDYHNDAHLDGFGGPGYPWPGPPNDWIHYDMSPYTDHEDWPHGDTTSGHGDVGYVSHLDGVGGHFDTGVDGDGPGIGFGHYDGGVWHGDGDNTQDLSPGVSGGYEDSHTDYTASGGSHTDTAHGDGAHSDAAHGDGSSGHTDSAHNDSAHNDISHVDLHTDQPISLGT